MSFYYEKSITKQLSYQFHYKRSCMQQGIDHDNTLGTIYNNWQQIDPG